MDYRYRRWKLRSTSVWCNSQYMRDRTLTITYELHVHLTIILHCVLVCDRWCVLCLCLVLRDIFLDVFCVNVSRGVLLMCRVTATGLWHVSLCVTHFHVMCVVYCEILTCFVLSCVLCYVWYDGCSDEFSDVQFWLWCVLPHDVFVLFAMFCCLWCVMCVCMCVLCGAYCGM